MKKILALYDEDSIYAARLMEYVKKQGWEDFDILLFTRQESLKDFLNYQPVEILLYGNKVFSEEILKNNIKYIFYLCEDQKLSQNEQYIFKYQPAGKITSEIISAYTKLKDNNEGTVFNHVRVISVFSPVNGAEKVSFAWLLAKELSKNKKVLFISLDMLPVDFMTLGNNNKYAMSEFLYYLKESRTNNIVKLKSYLNYSERLSYLSGIAHGFDLLSFSKEEADRLIQDIRVSGEYEDVIFYLGLYTEATMEIMQRSDQIYLAFCKLPYEEQAVKEWKRQMELMDVLQNQPSIQKIVLPPSDMMGSLNGFPENIFTLIRPLAAEVTELLLNKERSRYELAKGTASARSP